MQLDATEETPLHQLRAPPSFAEVGNNVIYPPVHSSSNQYYSVSNVWQNVEGEVLHGLEMNLFQQYRGNLDVQQALNLGNNPSHSEVKSPGPRSSSSKGGFIPDENIDPKQDPCVVVDSSALKNWFIQLQERVVIGLCHGVRPSAEAMKAWINTHRGSRNIRPSHVQYLPNNYYLFFFDNPAEALQVIGHGQWLIRNTPIFVFKWYEGFNPRGDKTSKVPVWVDFPNLPVEYYPWQKELGSYLGSALGQKSRGGFNLKWDPQLLVEIDLNKELIFEIPIKNSEGNWLHSQTVIYRSLPNACFHCNKMGHHIKHCPELNAKDPGPENKENNRQGFQQVSRRNSMKPPKNGKPLHPKGNSFKVLLEDVFDPFNHTAQSEHNPSQEPQKDLPVNNPQVQAHPIPTFSTSKSTDDQSSHMPNSPKGTHRNEELSSSSAESDEEAIPNS
ncbi:hypothetical protein L7F22_027457 [Adiantum nelumboides]|nr:hypothetical protein [Adiantum nelumboides]